MNNPYTKRRTAACQNWKKKRVVLPQKKRQVSPTTNSWSKRRKTRQKLNPKKSGKLTWSYFFSSLTKVLKIKFIHSPETEMLKLVGKKIVNSHLIKLKWIHFRCFLKQMKPLCYIASHGAAQPHSFSFAPLTRFVGRFENLGGKAIKVWLLLELVNPLPPLLLNLGRLLPPCPPHFRRPCTLCAVYAHNSSINLPRMTCWNSYTRKEGTQNLTPKAWDTIAYYVGKVPNKGP